MSAKAEKIVRDQLEERMVAGSVRMETDPKKLAALLDDRVDQDLRDLRTGPPRALDYANVIDALLARAELEGISHQEIESTRVARIAARGSFRGGMVWTPPDPVFHIMHEVPGRIRLEAATLKGDATACAAAEACLSHLHGVRSARANPLTGSLTVVHDGSAASRKAVMRALERLSWAPVEGEVPHPVMAPDSRKPSAEGLARRVAKVGLEQAVSTITERAIQIAAAALL
ncbi:MAG: HMA2 domain-containing protein [Rhodopila sp.]